MHSRILKGPWTLASLRSWDGLRRVLIDQAELSWGGGGLDEKAGAGGVASGKNGSG